MRLHVATFPSSLPTPLPSLFPPFSPLRVMAKGFTNGVVRFFFFFPSRKIRSPAEREPDNVRPSLPPFPIPLFLLLYDFPRRIIKLTRYHSLDCFPPLFPCLFFLLTYCHAGATGQQQGFDECEEERVRCRSIPPSPLPSKTPLFPPPFCLISPEGRIPLLGGNAEERSAGRPDKRSPPPFFPLFLFSSSFLLPCCLRGSARKEAKIVADSTTFLRLFLPSSLFFPPFPCSCSTRRTLDRVAAEKTC